jgi:hypothetical protein
VLWYLMSDAVISTHSKVNENRSHRSTDNTPKLSGNRDKSSVPNLLWRPSRGNTGSNENHLVALVRAVIGDALTTLHICTSSRKSSSSVPGVSGGEGADMRRQQQTFHPIHFDDGAAWLDGEQSQGFCNCNIALLNLRLHVCQPLVQVLDLGTTIGHVGAEAFDRSTGTVGESAHKRTRA